VNRLKSTGAKGAAGPVQRSGYGPMMFLRFRVHVDPTATLQFISERRRDGTELSCSPKCTRLHGRRNNAAEESRNARSRRRSWPTSEAQFDRTKLACGIVGRAGLDAVGLSWISDPLPLSRCRAGHGPTCRQNCQPTCTCASFGVCAAPCRSCGLPPRSRGTTAGPNLTRLS
jgi:hypothetical protein